MSLLADLLTLVTARGHFVTCGFRRKYPYMCHFCPLTLQLNLLLSDVIFDCSTCISPLDHILAQLNTARTA